MRCESGKETGAIPAISKRLIGMGNGDQIMVRAICWGTEDTAVVAIWKSLTREFSLGKKAFGLF